MEKQSGMSPDGSGVTHWGGPGLVREADKRGRRAWARSDRSRDPWFWRAPLTDGSACCRGFIEWRAETSRFRVFDRRHGKYGDACRSGGGLHLEDCDGVIAVGGGVAMEIGKAVALMAGQNRPFVDYGEDLNADEAWMAVETVATARWLAVPTTPFGAALVGGATVLADDLSRAVLVRHPNMRPERVVLDPALLGSVSADVWGRSVQAACALATDLVLTWKAPRPAAGPQICCAFAGRQRERSSR